MELTERGSIMDPVEAFMRALCRYLRERGHMLFSMASSAGQKQVKIALLGLWRRHDADLTGYPRFMDVVDAVRSCGECMEKLRESGVDGFTEYEGELYVVVDVERLRKTLVECDRSTATA
ncbi:MAG: hypothetical protein ABWW70_03480 [Thermoproteota archaeon]